MARTSSSPGVATFISGLPEDRRREVERVRKIVRKNLPAGYEEAASLNMLVYQVPLQRYPDTYNGQPLCYVGLGAQQNYLTLYLMRVYGDAAQRRRLESAFKREGKKLDMGKACIRFKKADDLPLDTIGELVASTPLKQWVDIAEAARRR